MIAITCDSCHKKLAANDELAGKKVKCPGCGKVLPVPQPAASLSPLPASPAGGEPHLLPPKPGGQPEKDNPAEAGGHTAVAAGREAETTVSLPDKAGVLKDGPGSDLYAFLAPPQKPDEIGRLGPYRVLQVLGAGGMGVVFKAEDPHLDRLVALKAMLPALASNPTAKERFFREAKAAAALKHPHIVTIHQVGEDRGAPFLAMEFLEGEPLDERLKRQPIVPLAELRRIGGQVAEGLAAAHERGLIHRDIKPANIWLEQVKLHGTVATSAKILDFGLARALADQTQLTREGALVGTPAYMAPEQAGGETVDARCDLFSLGCVLYRMATGTMAFQGESTIAILAAVALQTPVPPTELNADIPPELSDLILTLLAKKAADRPASAHEVARTLRELEGTGDKTVQTVGKQRSTAIRKTGSGKTSTHDSARKKWPLLAGAAALLAVLAAAIVVFWPKPSGTVRLESDDPGVEIVFDGTGPTIKGADREPISLRAGEHSVLVKRGDFSFETDKLAIEKGQAITLKIEVVGNQMRLVRDGQVIAARDMPLPREYTNSLGMEFVLVPKGKSWLGGGGGKPGDKEVEILHDFYLGKYEVTQEEWEKVTGNNPSHFSRTGAGKDAVKEMGEGELKRFPVENVSWADVQLFLGRFNERHKEAGWVYRLPKEAEWEYACRGGPLGDKFGSAFDFYFEKPTKELLPGQANFEYGKGLKRTCKVGSYKPNRLGLYDMHGNVWEWCEDELPQPKGTSLRVVRGGSWNDVAGDGRAVSRYTNPPSIRYSYLGLRLARVPVGKEIVKIIDVSKPAQAPPGPLDKLDPKNIPAAERFPWQPKELVAVLGEHRRRHSGMVHQVAYSGDGRWIASIGLDGLFLIDAKTLQEKMVPGVAGDGGVCVAFGPDGKTLAARKGKDVVLWDVSGNEPRHRDVVPVKGLALAFSRDGRILAVADESSQLSRWVVSGKEARETGKRIRIEWNGGAPRFAVSADGNTVVLAGADGVPRLWDLSGEKPVEKASLKKHDRLMGVAYSLDDRFVFTVNQSAAILRIWDVTRTPPTEVTSEKLGMTASYDPLAVPRDGKTLALGGDLGVVIFEWDGKALTRKNSLSHPGCNSYTHALSPDTKTVVTGSGGGEVRIWDLGAKEIKERDPLGVYNGPGFPLFSRDGARLVIGRNPSSIRGGGGSFAEKTMNVPEVYLWNLSEPQPVLFRPLVNTSGAFDLAFNAEDRLVAWGSGGAKLLAVGPAGLRHEVDIDLRDLYPAKRWAPDANRLATCGMDGVIRFWKLTRNAARKDAEVKLIPAPQFHGWLPLDRLGLSPDQRWAANGWEDGTVHLWDLATGKEKAVLKSSTDWPVVVFSRDGSKLAFGDGPVVRLYDLRGPAPRETEPFDKAPAGPMVALDFSPDGRLLAGADRSGNLSVWNLATGVRYYECKLMRLETLRWAEDSRHLATVNGNGTIYILRIPPPPSPAR